MAEFNPMAAEASWLMRTAAQEDHILRPIANHSIDRLGGRGKEPSKEEEVELDPNWRTHSIHSISHPSHS